MPFIEHRLHELRAQMMIVLTGIYKTNGMTEVYNQKTNI